MLLAAGSFPVTWRKTDSLVLPNRTTSRTDVGNRRDWVYYCCFSWTTGLFRSNRCFFAGLVFSRDPEAVRFDASFDSIYELFVPFFFIGIGLKIVPNALLMGLGMGMVLLVAAIIGKLIGAGVPALLTTNLQGATLIGVSMVPRAEISTIVMERGLSLGDWAVPAQEFAAMVVVFAATSSVAPILLRSLLSRWPQKPETNST